jgi:chromosome segregation ATPase
MQLKISTFIIKARKYQDQLEVELKKIKRQTNQANRIKKLEKALKLLKTESGAYPQHMLNDQITYLYGMINDADQLPGKDVEMRLDELTKEFENIQKSLE